MWKLRQKVEVPLKVSGVEPKLESRTTWLSVAGTSLQTTKKINLFTGTSHLVFNNNNNNPLPPEQT